MPLVPNRPPQPSFEDIALQGTSEYGAPIDSVHEPVASWTAQEPVRTGKEAGAERFIRQLEGRDDPSWATDERSEDDATN